MLMIDEVKIGFEIHEQLATRTKLFCKCSTDYRNAEPNTNVCEICTGQPGAKPMAVNKEALEAAITIALMLGCEIKREVIFLRKHYDYPDLPNGYQRTSTPIGVNGELAGVRIWEVHLEEDPGKYDPITGRVDYNRCGVPLIEIVTAPDIKSPEQAREFLKELVKIFDYSNKTRKEGGTMRVDVNISIANQARVEIKNINSIKGVYKALKYEIMRQKNLLKRGIKIRRETRAFIEEQMITKPMRLKEYAEDYRYIPDPDVLPIKITDEMLEKIKRNLPETPMEKEKKLMEKYGLPKEVARVIASEYELAKVYEEVARHVDAKFAAYWIKDELKRVLEYNDLTFAQSGIKIEHLIELLKMIKNEEITVKVGKKIIEMMIGNSKSPREIAKEMGLLNVISDEETVKKVVLEVINENKKAVQDYLSGKKEAINYLVGQVMKKTKGRVKPQIVIKYLNKFLNT